MGEALEEARAARAASIAWWGCLATVFRKAKVLGFVVLLGVGLSANAQSGSDDQETGTIPGIIWAVERAICIAECGVEAAIQGAMAASGAVTARNTASIMKQSSLQTAQEIYMGCRAQADLAPIHASCDAEIRRRTAEINAGYDESIRQINAQLVVELAQIAVRAVICAQNCIFRWTRW